MDWFLYDKDYVKKVKIVMKELIIIYQRDVY